MREYTWINQKEKHFHFHLPKKRWLSIFHWVTGGEREAAVWNERDSLKGAISRSWKGVLAPTRQEKHVFLSDYAQEENTTTNQAHDRVEWKFQIHFNERSFGSSTLRAISRWKTKGKGDNYRCTGMVTMLTRPVTRDPRPITTWHRCLKAICVRRAGSSGDSLKGARTRREKATFIAAYVDSRPPRTRKNGRVSRKSDSSPFAATARGVVSDDPPPLSAVVTSFLRQAQKLASWISPTCYTSWRKGPRGGKMSMIVVKSVP